MNSQFWLPDRPIIHEDYTEMESLTLYQVKELRKEHLQSFYEAIEKYRAFIEAASDRHQQFEKDLGYKRAKFGQVLIERYMMLHQANVLCQLTPEEHRRQRAQIIHMAPTEIEGRDIISGVLSQYAASEALKFAAESGDFPALDELELYYPSDKEDLTGGVDLWGRIGNTAYSFQVKSTPLKEKCPNQVVYTMDDAQNLEQVLTQVLSPDMRDVAWVDPVRLLHVRDNIANTAENQLRYANNFRNVVPVLIMLASPESEGSQMNSLTGEPKPELVEQIGSRLQTIHRQKNRRTPPAYLPNTYALAA